eukprot:CAMPEP_0198150638 /NCGR_PEP_ID=MMETSP1443-20131203/51786_1 /TAXON_ID=186043 /ORGANISM="Entomoneis sp., Strain CCMP2396" /LENGTH=561 /DNA_ID=CAMNT_0043816009 /DNA_START=60 /DNA_END=1742 /DNA_ORIENTATION=+
MTLSEAAIAACEAYPSADVELALAFAKEAVPSFLKADNDRLIKFGRSVKSMVNMKDDLGFNLEESLTLAVEESELLMSGKLKVPKVKFGKTGLDISVVTLGCMRFQQEWGPRITNMNMVDGDCQDNLMAILKRALLEFGINHIETARGYGSAELQLGVALKQLIMTNQIKREDFILQTKVAPMKDPADFRKTLEKSFEYLQVDYLDLFAFHGVNWPEQLIYMFGDDQTTEGTETCYSIIQEYVKAGKIRHVGFSTHGSTDLILETVNKGVFDYANIHYHFMGSYTASGGGHDGQGNRDVVRLMNEKNMGVFIISPFDKGGSLFIPSRKLRRLTLPDLEPMAFESMRIWNHHHLFEDLNIHTYTAGAARPSDLDQSAVAAYLHDTQNDRMVQKLKRVSQRLLDEREKVLGKEWADTWWKGLSKADGNKHHVEHNQIMWFYNCLHSFGLYHFTKARYHSFENNLKNWKDDLSDDENVKKLQPGWGFVPGLPLKPGVDYSGDFTNVPGENKQRVLEAEAFVLDWLATAANKTKVDPKDEHDAYKKAKTEAKVIPEDWQDAYDMR